MSGSQCDLILDVMRRDGHITKRVADTYRIENLKGRISDLRDAGHKIKTTFKLDALGKKYAQYSLSDEDSVRTPVLVLPMGDALEATDLKQGVVYRRTDRDEPGIAYMKTDERLWPLLDLASGCLIPLWAINGSPQARFVPTTFTK